MMSIGILIAALAAYWVYTDAREHGHGKPTALLWAAGTLGMLIVFLPLYLFVGRKPNMNKQRREEVIDVEAVAADDSVKVHCPMCGSKVKEDFKLCPYCGFALKPQCQNCGKDLQREWKVCPYCQTPTTEK